MKYLLVLLSLLVLSLEMMAQGKKDGIITRVAQIEVYPQYLEEYLQAAHEVAETSMRNEQGVLFLYPMQVEREKNKIVILESLELIDTHPLLPELFRAESKKLPAVESGSGVKKVITIEEHFTLPAIRAKVMKYLTEQNGGVPPVSEAQRELMKIVLPTNDNIDEVGERRLRFMDEAGVDMQVLSYGAGSPQNITDTALAIAWCREANDELARLIALHPTRFSGFALLPVTAPHAAAKELERAVTVLRLKGAMLSGTCNGRFFDEREFRPIFAKAAELNVPIYLHPATINPTVANYYYKSKQWSPVAAEMFATAGFGWHADLGVGVLRLILSGLFDELPELQIIVGHWGELVPFYLNRLDDQQSKTLQLRYKISDYFKRNIYLTPSGFFSNEQLEYVVKTLGADRIIYSADHPFLLDRDTRKFLERAPLSEEEKAKIGYLNAERLLRLSN